MDPQEELESQVDRIALMLGVAPRKMDTSRNVPLMSGSKAHYDRRSL
jgi:hypothetical protein